MKPYQEKIFPKVLRLPEVLEVTQLSRSTIYSLMANDDFPKHISLGARAVAWIEAEVYQWLELRIASRVDSSLGGINNG